MYTMSYLPLYKPSYVYNISTVILTHYYYITYTHYIHTIYPYLTTLVYPYIILTYQDLETSLQRGRALGRKPLTLLTEVPRVRVKRGQHLSGRQVFYQYIENKEVGQNYDLFVFI